MLKSPIAYPGSKNKCIDLILDLIPEDIDHWKESFFGGGSVTLSYLQSHKCHAKTFTVCELSPEVWAFWQGIKLDAPQVVRIANEWINANLKKKLAFEGISDTNPDHAKLREEVCIEGKLFWDWLHKVDCKTLSLYERSARFLIANKISYSGLTDSGSLSYVRLTKFRTRHLDSVLQIQPLLQKIDIRNVSFEELFTNEEKGKTFMFLDPPYLNQGEKSPLYGKNGDSHTNFDHNLLADMLNKAKFDWLMTYDDSVAVRRLYSNCSIKPFKLNYTVSGFKSFDALDGEELFISNYDINKDEEDLYNLL